MNTSMTLRNIKYRTEEDHRAAGGNPTLADALFAIHLLATAVEELVTFIERAPQEMS